MRRAYLILAIVALCLAQSKPNLSGEWKMNRARSSWGLWGEPPDEMTASVSQKGSDIRIDITSVANNVRRVQQFNVTKGECSTDCTAEWDGAVLVITRKIPAKDNQTGKAKEMVWKTRWTLSGEGKTLTMVSRPEEFASTNFDQRAVFEKQ